MSRATYLILALALALACNKKQEAAPVVEQSPSAVSSKKRVVKVRRESSYAEELTALDARIGSTEARLHKQPTSTVISAQLASLFVSRAKLTGDYRDYDRAANVIDAAFNGESGPYVARASLRYALHDLAGALGDLDHAVRVPVMGKKQEPAITGLRGSIHFHAGRYEEALRDLEHAVALERSPWSLSRLALYRWKTGDFDAAEKLYDEAESRYHGREAEPRAWFHLLRGLMDLERGRLDEAMAHYEDGARAMQGWWLLREHMAEIHALKGMHREAASIYREVVAETGSPELMAAYADVLDELGEEDAAAKMRSQALAEFEQRVEKWPSAASGHALEFYLEQDKVERALELAEANYELRPGGEGAILLARALLKAGQVDRAKSLVTGVLESPYRTAEAHWVASLVFAAAKDEARARAERSAALAIDPTLGAN